MKIKKIIIVFLLTILLINPSYADDNVVLKWNELALNTIKDTRTAPPVASRVLTILHTAIFDAWAPYDLRANGTILGGTLRRPEEESTNENKEKAISYAAYKVLVDLFPSEIDSFKSLMEELGFDVSNASTDTTTPEGIGNTVASELIEFRHSDGSNQLGDLSESGQAYSDYTGYVSLNTADTLNDPGRWQPLLTSGSDWVVASPGDPAQTFLTPHWGQVTPFALESGSEFRPDPPAPYPSKEYNKQALEIVKIGAKLNDFSKTIAEYWEDGAGSVTPPGHWNEIAEFVSIRDSHLLDDDVKMFFILNNAIFDAGIAAWEAKRFYDYARPITAITFLFQDKSIPEVGSKNVLIPGIIWQSYFPTPPHPDHVSGHSAFSAAAATVLRLYTGSDNYNNSIVIEPGSSNIEPGATPRKKITLSWKTFSQAANQAGLSRRYGGIHFKNADYGGRELGKKVGEKVFNKATSYIEGDIVIAPK